jgi:DNA processing protein
MAAEPMAVDVSTRGRNRLSRRVVCGDADYPPRLLDLERIPSPVWMVGDLRLGTHTPTVAIVGTRNMTSYGERVTRHLATGLGRAGACIVSGMARGVDSVAHRAALACGAPTIAVLASGVDIAYPASNRPLHREIAQNGLLLSQFVPGARAHKGAFLERNKLIAALASLTIVVEGGPRSGALKTLGYAIDLSREVGVVPGPIDSPQSEGTNLSLSEGTPPIISLDHALQIIGLSRGAPLSVRLESEAEERVWAALAEPAPSLDLLCSRVGLPARDCLAAVTALELQGAVECALTGDVRRRI